MACDLITPKKKNEIKKTEKDNLQEKISKQRKIFGVKEKGKSVPRVIL